MSDNKPVTVTSLDVKRIKPNTPEMAQYLSAGYQMTLEQAKAIIKERDADPATYPYEVYAKAKAFLAAYETAPTAVSTDPGWKRLQRKEA